MRLGEPLKADGQHPQVSLGPTGPGLRDRVEEQRRHQHARRQRRGGHDASVEPGPRAGAASFPIRRRAWPGSGPDGGLAPGGGLCGDEPQRAAGEAGRRRAWLPLVLQRLHCQPQRVEIPAERRPDPRVGQRHFNLHRLGIVEGAEEVADQLLSHG